MNKLHTRSEADKDRELCRWALRLAVLSVFAVCFLALCFAVHVDAPAVAIATKVLDHKFVSTSQDEERKTP